METGQQIIQYFLEKKLDYQEIEMILVGNHAPFTWGKNSQKALYNAAVLEEIARMAWLTEQINPQAPLLKDALIKKHFERKHGPDAYYGQQ
jgi:L-ribulose-5-phosphate 4-epimerase